MSRALIAGAILGAGLVSGGLLIQSGAWREADAATGSVRLLDQVMARLRSDYVDSLSVDDLYRRTALGFVKELDDPHSELLSPDRYRRLRETTTGNLVIVDHSVRRAQLVGGVAYIALASFSERAASDLRRAIDSLRKAGGRSLILDLRENPGGLLEQGIAVADLFLDDGQTIVSTRGRSVANNQEFNDDGPQRWPGMPIVGLVDSGSASASEIVAGALQDHGRAVLVGTATLGKGSAQNIFPMNDGYALKLTTARWFTPNGRSIERDSTAGGITPDVEVEAAVRSTSTDSKTPASRLALDLSTDPVVLRALQLLDGVATPAELRKRAPRRK